MHWLGIRREDKNDFERRVPLTPAHLKLLGEAERVRVKLQPSPRRIFDDDAFRRAGAAIDEDLSDCGIIMGVKEIPSKLILAHKVYLFFSHTIKGQPQNMPMLRRLARQKCTLIDYERIVDETGRRLVFFGRHAGLAGMIDTLWALGRRLASEGLQTPFAAVKQSYHYASLVQAKSEIQLIGQQLASGALPQHLCPLVFGVTGYGNVSTGAQEILDLLQPREIAPADLLQLGPSDRGLYKTLFHEHHMVQSDSGSFDLQDYYQHPEGYRSVFQPYLQHLGVLVNCIYWDERYPRLVTLQQLKELFASGAPRLKVIGDISCDVQGSIEATLRSTTPDNPVYVYDTLAGAASDGVRGHGPVIMAVDNLPAELPTESSEYFSEMLTPFIPALLQADYTGSFAACQLPDPIRRAVILFQGELTEDYQYLAQYLR